MGRATRTTRAHERENREHGEESWRTTNQSCFPSRCPATNRKSREGATPPPEASAAWWETASPRPTEERQQGVRLEEVQVNRTQAPGSASPPKLITVKLSIPSLLTF